MASEPKRLEVKLSLRGGVSKILEVCCGEGKKINYRTEIEEVLMSGANEICINGYRYVKELDCAETSSGESPIRKIIYEAKVYETL